MQVFPAALASYALANKIKLTPAEERSICGYFNDNGTINLMRTFENFAFRYADKQLLLSIGELTREATRKNILVIEKDHSYLKFGNPNAEYPTVFTIVGEFYASEIASNTENDTSMLKGNKISLVYKIQHFVCDPGRNIIFRLI